MFPLHDDNPTTIKPIVTIVLIVICILVWLATMGQLQTSVLSLGAIPAVITGEKQLAPEFYLVPSWMTVVTSMFMHGGWMHLIGNMLYLWIFGNNVEDSMGHTKFLVFYITCGLIALLAHMVGDTGSTVPMVGASGAISGVLGAYLLLYPHARVLVAVPIVIIITLRLPAGIVLAFWFVLQIFNSVLANGSPDSGVAWGAHIGGFVAGMILIPFFKDSSHRLFTPKH
ncbi:MAG: rhomboid family intramembrane serine protease [Gammaproteobacteria bacterium]|nr:rhomboid family intramembrane serine protease [Gammaproteobacteria bacterium]MDH5801045.1 rhomboid family intramembrane serine protease [Gammaproteobacteria bacterium]